MARFPDHFIEELKRALPVSAVVGRTHKLRKKSAGEYECIDDKSLTVNDRKGLWYDFGKRQDGGDIIDWYMLGGGTFEQAVEELAKQAGLSLPRPAAPKKGNGHAKEAPPQASPAAPDTGRHVEATYEYRDADGAVQYEEVKISWLENGARKKSVFPRRTWPGVPGYIWGLKAATYVRGRAGDWYNAEGREAWDGERREIDETAPLLYRFPELQEEIADAPEERRTIFIPEGPKDCDTLAAWGCVATTSSGGTSGWLGHFAHFFVDCDVVIPIDNDAAGFKFGHAKAHSLRAYAKRVRILDLKTAWPGCPAKADVSDWAAKGGGTAARLWEIVDKLPDWRPEPPDSSFGALRFVDLDRPARELEWLIKKTLTRGEVSIWYGPPGCGKSFLLLDAAMAVARGISWMGQRVRQGLVIYQAGEGGLGLKKRMRAYRSVHKIAASENLPVVLLPKPVNLYVDDADVGKLIDEIKQWASYYDSPLEFVIIDTFSAASPGADENASRDVSPVLQRCRRISAETGAHVALVHHTPKAGGSPRGWSGLTGNIENAIEVIRTEQTHQEAGADGRRHIRDIREFVTTKQKDDEDHFRRQFVLKQVILGQDSDDQPITSCAVWPLEGIDDDGPGRAVPMGYVDLKPTNLMIFKSLVAALQTAGQISPPGSPVPDYTTAVRVADWQEAMVERNRGHGDDDDKLKARVKKAIQRACEAWNPQGLRLIVKNGEWVWRTDRKVHGIDKPPQVAYAASAPKPQAPMLGPPGDDEFAF